MKITVNIDCTPEEARAFLGLPDVRPMQDQMMQEVQERAMTALRAMEPAEMMRMWLPSNLEGMEKFFKAFTGMGGSK